MSNNVATSTGKTLAGKSGKDVLKAIKRRLKK